MRNGEDVTISTEAGITVLPQAIASNRTLDNHSGILVVYPPEFTSQDIATLVAAATEAYVALQTVPSS